MGAIWRPIAAKGQMASPPDAGVDWDIGEVKRRSRYGGKTVLAAEIMIQFAILKFTTTSTSDIAY